MNTTSKILTTAGLLAAILTGTPQATAAPIAATAKVVAPLVKVAKATPSAVGEHGGKVAVYGRVNTATTECQLRLLSSQDFPVVYASNKRHCHVNFKATVTIGGNPKDIRRTVAFELLAFNGKKVSRGRFYISVAPWSPTSKAPRPKPTPPKPVTPPPAPDVPAGPSPVPYTSNNWSGYALTGGPFYSVSGTFTVPYVTTAATCDETLSEWVGIDGDDNNALIQAGVDETVFNEYTDACTPGEFYVTPWWEVLPAPATTINTMTVDAGNSVTVTIILSSGVGYITVKDDTTGQSFTTEQPYSGPAKSAEWITEAFSSTVCSNSGSPQQCAIAPYTPAVRFSGLSENGSVGQVQAITMQQNNVSVSTPSLVADLSALLTDGFTTTYTG